jgi:hypothetical protein
LPSLSFFCQLFRSLCPFSTILCLCPYSAILCLLFFSAIPSLLSCLSYSVLMAILCALYFLSYSLPLVLSKQFRVSCSFLFRASCSSQLYILPFLLSQPVIAYCPPSVFRVP